MAPRVHRFDSDITVVIDDVERWLEIWAEDSCLRLQSDEEVQEFIDSLDALRAGTLTAADPLLQALQEAPACAFPPKV